MQTFNARRGMVPGIITFLVVCFLALPFIGGKDMNVVKTIEASLIWAVSLGLVAWFIGSMPD